MDKVTAIIGFVIGALLAGLIVYTVEQHTIKNLNSAHDTDITNQITADKMACGLAKQVTEGIDNDLQKNLGAIDADFAGRVYDSPGAAACVSVASHPGSGDASAPGDQLQPAARQLVQREALDRITHAADKEVAKLRACQSLLKAERTLQQAP